MFLAKASDVSAAAFPTTACPAETRQAVLQLQAERCFIDTDTDFVIQDCLLCRLVHNFLCLV